MHRHACERSVNDPEKMAGEDEALHTSKAWDSGDFFDLSFLPGPLLCSPGLAVSSTFSLGHEGFVGLKVRFCLMALLLNVMMSALLSALMARSLD